ncbi:MarR family transcriptional regulator [Actinomycetes bacterium KLBMP 9797]
MLTLAAPPRDHAELTPAATTQAAAVADALLATSRVLVALAASSIVHVDAEVTLVQFRGLVVLASRGPQRTVDLAVELEVAPSTATRMCDRLVRRDLVRRYRRMEDRRATWVGLTERGRDLVGQVMHHRQAAIGELVRATPVADPEILVAALDAFVRTAGETPESQWWLRWEVSTTPPPDTVTA